MMKSETKCCISQFNTGTSSRAYHFVIQNEDGVITGINMDLRSYFSIEYEFGKKTWDIELVYTNP